MPKKPTDTVRYRVVERGGREVLQQWRLRPSSASARYGWIDVWERKSEARAPAAPETAPPVSSNQ
jgi:hypothetical protein